MSDGVPCCSFLLTAKYGIQLYDSALRFAGHRYVAAPEIKVDIVTKQAHTQVARGAEAAWHTGDIQVLRQNESNPRTRTFRQVGQ